MKNFCDYLLKYGLHDCIIDNVSLNNERICFNFGSGVYKLDETGKEIELTIPCVMVVEIEKNDEISNSMQINVTRRKRTKNIDFCKFVCMLNKSNFDVDINLYSHFCKTIMLQGYIDKTKITITVSEVKRVIFDFRRETAEKGDGSSSPNN